MPGDPVSSYRDQADIGITLSMQVEHALLDWSLVNIGLKTVWLNGVVRVNRSRLKWRCLLLISEESSSEAKGEL